jgi:hypothetical protein
LKTKRDFLDTGGNCLKLGPKEPSNHVKMIQSRWEMSEKGMIWVNFSVPLATATQILSSDQPNSDLTATHPAELITKEMDKKELKAYQSKK